MQCVCLPQLLIRFYRFERMHPVTLNFETIMMLLSFDNIQMYHPTQFDWRNVISQIAKFMRPTWVLSAPDGPHVGPMNLAIRGIIYHPMYSNCKDITSHNAACFSQPSGYLIAPSFPPHQHRIRIGRLQRRWKPVTWSDLLVWSSLTKTSIRTDILYT